MIPLGGSAPLPSGLEPAASGGAVLDAVGTASIVLYFSCLCLLALYGAHRLWLALVVARQPRPRARPAPPRTPDADLPVVTVQCPVYDEPRVARRLLDAVCAFDYPRDRLEIQVLDDSDDGSSAELERRAAEHAARGTRVRVMRRDGRVGFKAGALQHGLLRASGSLVAVFDADFVPEPGFLRRVVPAFADPDVGLVQARWSHLNRTSSWFTRVQALMLDGHFRVEHAARALRGRFFNFNGTAGVFRRACIEEAGGWQHDTLTEDLDLSYRAQLAGWRFVFLDDVAVPAELPAEVAAWKGQQRRWTQGSVQTARKLLPRVLAAPLSPWVKLEAFLHLTNNAAYPLLLALCLATFPAAAARHARGWDQLLAVELPILLATTGVVCAFYCVAARRDGGAWPAALLPRLLAVGVGASLNNTRAVLRGLWGDVGEFVRTPKTGDLGRGTTVPSRPAADPWGAVEVAFGLALAAQAALGVRLGLWPTVPFLGLFSAGFLAVGASSFRRRRPLDGSRRRGPVTESRGPSGSPARP